MVKQSVTHKHSRSATTVKEKESSGSCYILCIFFIWYIAHVEFTLQYNMHLLFKSVQMTFNLKKIQVGSLKCLVKFNFLEVRPSRARRVHREDPFQLSTHPVGAVTDGVCPVEAAGVWMSYRL